MGEASESSNTGQGPPPARSSRFSLPGSRYMPEIIDLEDPLTQPPRANMTNQTPGLRELRQQLGSLLTFLWPSTPSQFVPHFTFIRENGSSSDQIPPPHYGEPLLPHERPHLFHFNPAQPVPPLYNVNPAQPGTSNQPWPTPFSPGNTLFFPPFNPNPFPPPIPNLSLNPNPLQPPLPYFNPNPFLPPNPNLAWNPNPFQPPLPPFNPSSFTPPNPNHAFINPNPFQPLNPFVQMNPSPHPSYQQPAALPYARPSSSMPPPPPRNTATNPSSDMPPPSPE